MVMVTEIRCFAHQNDEKPVKVFDVNVSNVTMFAHHNKIPQIRPNFLDYMRTTDYDEIARWYEERKIKTNKEEFEEFLKTREPFARIEIVIYEWEFY